MATSHVVIDGDFLPAKRPFPNVYFAVKSLSFAFGVSDFFF